MMGRRQAVVVDRCQGDAVQLTVRRRASLTAVTAIALLLVASPAGADPSPEVVNIAHRGASDVAPENTLAAFSQAVAERADVVEVDIRLTKDEVSVLMHNKSLARTTDVEDVFPRRAPWRVQDFTLRQIGRLDAGEWRSPDYQGQAVPTLDAALEELAGSPVGVVLEVKDPDLYGGVAGIGQHVMSVVASHPRWAGAVRREKRELVVQSFDWNFLRGLSTAQPGLRVSLVGAITAEKMDAYRASHPT